MAAPINIHATGLVLAGAGVMVRGASGTGKSLLALELLAHFEGRGLRARLVGDDRLDIGVEAGRVVMRAPAAIAGLIELRGRGIVMRPHVARAPVDLVVDLVPEFVRLPEDEAFVTEIMEVKLARAPVPQAGVAGLGHQRLLVLEALRALPETPPFAAGPKDGEKGA